MIKPRIKLPGQPTQKQELLPIGTRVKLENAPHGEEGVVEGTLPSRLVIRWPALGYVGRYRPESLIVVGAVKLPEAREDPYARLIRKFHADMHVNHKP